jgi:hypothetical protein
MSKNRKQRQRVERRVEKQPTTPPNEPKWRGRARTLLKWIGVPTTLVGLLGFFPNLTISDPTSMDANEFFSKYLIVKNEGLLPVFRSHCGLSLAGVVNAHGPSLLPYGKGDDPAFEPPEWRIGALWPTDQFTISTENIVEGIASNDVRSADFDVYVSYMPVLPPIQMNKCVHFSLHRDSAGTPRWFRQPGHCRLFPWFHR